MCVFYQGLRKLIFGVYMNRENLCLFCLNLYKIKFGGEYGGVDVQKAFTFLWFLVYVRPL